MNNLAGDGSRGSGGASGAERGAEMLFLSPPSHYSHSPGCTTRNRMAPAYWIICQNDFLVLSRVCAQLSNKLDLRPDLFISISRYAAKPQKCGVKRQHLCHLSFTSSRPSQAVFMVSTNTPWSGIGVSILCLLQLLDMHLLDFRDNFHESLVILKLLYP